MAVSPSDAKAAFQNAIPYLRAAFELSVNNRLKTIVYEHGYVQRYPEEVLLMASDELRARIKLAAARVKQLIGSGWSADQMTTVRKVFLDCFGTFDRWDKDPQTDLYHAVEGAFGKVGQHNPAQATMNHRRLSQVQVDMANEFLSDLELYYAERHPSSPQVAPETAIADAAAVAEAVSHFQVDAFVSYASEDKAFVKDLAARLRSAGIKLWVDEAELTVGDTLRGKIDEGLKSCQYGIVVLSESFFQKPWPQSELDALVGIQNVSGRKVILPVWLDVTFEQVCSHSPILAGRMAARSSDGFEKVVADLLRVLTTPTT
jgi:hypothetical protein